MSGSYASHVEPKLSKVLTPKSQIQGPWHRWPVRWSTVYAGNGSSTGSSNGVGGRPCLGSWTWKQQSIYCCLNNVSAQYPSKKRNPREVQSEDWDDMVQWSMVHGQTTQSNPVDDKFDWGNGPNQPNQATSTIHKPMVLNLGWSPCDKIESIIYYQGLWGQAN